MSVIKGKTQSLQWLSDMLAFFQREEIIIPSDYRTRVLETKKVLNDDTSGLVGSLLDFAVNTALVDYSIETDNENLTKTLNDWLNDINSEVRGKIPTGISALAKEYFRERWKGSSNLLLRTMWNKKDGLNLPTVLYFIDGEDVKIKTSSKDGVVRLGDEMYALRINDYEKDDINLPSGKDEKIFVQKPFESWGTRYPVPFLIKRGLYRNLKFLTLLYSKGEFVVGRALEYLMVIKKGTERMALEGRGEYTYSEEDLKGIRDDLKNLLLQKKTEAGTPTYTTNFDTELEHFIPEYEKALKDELFGPVERRLLGGLGIINIVEGIGATRRETIMNPKPFISEVEQGIADFKALLKDILETIVQENVGAHKKWMNSKIRIVSTPIKTFMTDKVLSMLRSLYDRGRLSSRTLVEVVGNTDYEVEVNRRKQEKASGDEAVLFPPVIQNMGGDTNMLKDDILQDRQGPEKKNFMKSTWDTASVNYAATMQLRCDKCGHVDDISVFLDTLIVSDEYEKTVAVCPGCSEELLEEDVDFVVAAKTEQTPEKVLEQSVVYEEAPYKTNKDLPPSVQDLPVGAKTIWRTTYNSVLKSTNSEDQARQSAWRNVKLKYKKEGNRWVRKTKGEFEQSVQELDLDEVLKIKRLEIFSKQSKVLDNLIKGSIEEDTVNAEDNNSENI